MQYGTFHSENNCLGLSELCCRALESAKGERIAQYLTGVVSTRNQYKYTLCLGNDTQIETLWAARSQVSSLGLRWVERGVEGLGEWQGMPKPIIWKQCILPSTQGKKSHMYH